MASNPDDVEARRRKIRELESKLFDNEWTSERTDLPQLKNVNEYASKYNLAEAQKQPSRPKSLRPIKRPSSLFKMRKKETFDEIPLIVDDDEDDETVLEESKKVSKTLSKTQRLLKSEVEQLDEAFSKIFNDEPALNVIENLKKKHGLLIGRDKTAKYKSFDDPDFEKRNVESFHQKMNRARTSDQIKQDKLRRHSAALLDDDNLSYLSIQGQKLPQKPNIVVSPSDKQRRELPVINQEKDRLAVSQEGMISYAHLEMIPSEAPGETFRDLNGTFDEMPSDTFNDLATDKTFDDIPNDVFDRIPRAVSARAEARLIKLQEQMLQENFLQRQASQNTPEQVSFIAALFSTDKSKSHEVLSGNIEEDNEDADDEDSKEDFLLALFIAQQDSQALTQSKPEPEEKDAANALIGHFCAPWVPGFCQEHFCIFHNPISNEDGKEETTGKGNMVEHSG